MTSTPVYIAAATLVTLIAPGLALLRTPDADRRAIRVAYQGLLGLAGPHMTVTEVRRSGIEWYGPSAPIYRKYIVTLENVGGGRSQRVALSRLGQFGTPVIKQSMAY